MVAAINAPISFRQKKKNLIKSEERLPVERELPGFDSRSQTNTQTSTLP